VADVPEVTVFKPVGIPMSQLYGVVLGLDGFEALRLVDGEGLSQEEAAARMQVSRPTLCRILGEARGQVARALSRGWAIRIEVDVQHAVTNGREQDISELQCTLSQVCGGGRARGGRSCRDREDKVAQDVVRAAEVAARAVADAAAVAADSVRAPEPEA
jgi:predicted DNA-binding protein (UPF0251 family)